MAVQKLPSGKYRAIVYDASTGRKRSVGTFRLKGEAVDAVNDARRDIRVSMGVERVTIAEWRERWLEESKRVWKPSTSKHYRERTRSFVAAHGDDYLREFSLDAAAAWAMRNPSTVMTLKAMFLRASRLGLIDSSPWLVPQRRKNKRNLEASFLPVEDVRRLAQAALKLGGDGQGGDNVWGPVASAAVLISAWTGIRPGELYELRLSDVRANGRLSIERAWTPAGGVDRPKSGHARTVVLPAPAERALRESAARAAELGAEGGLVVCTPTGARLRGPSWSPYWRAIKAGAGVRQDLRYYDLRHFCATWLIEQGASTYDVAQQLGHSDGGKLVVSTYSHPEGEVALGRVAERFKEAA